MKLLKLKRRLLSLLPRDREKPVMLNSMQLSSNFRKYRPKELQDLHFHDIRYEVLSRMGKIVTNPIDLAKISGNKGVNVLMSVYYNPNNNDLVELFD